MPAESTATMTIEEAAKLLGIGRNQAYAAAKRGDLPILKLGKRLLVLRLPFERILRGEVTK
jgi:excisionase family DNA binding protein